MAINTSRLDRLLSDACNINRKKIRLILAQKRVFVDGVIAVDVAQIVDHFSHVVMDDKTIQANKSYYIMLHKPIGVVCATKDDKHKTVIDLLRSHYPEDIISNLHIVGRLDLNTSGLVLLTNDSRWSERLTSPEFKVEKRYHVTLANELTSDYVDAFAQGMYFAFEEITTKPAQLSIISAHKADVVLTEGRYHQIKRMFGRYRNPVIGLHRYAIGKITLDESLKAEDSRMLSEQEVLGVTG